MIKMFKEWWRDTFHPIRRSTYVPRGPLAFRANHRAGRPVVNQGIGSETRPVPIIPRQPPLPDPKAYARRLLHQDQAASLDPSPSSQET